MRVALIRGAISVVSLVGCARGGEAAEACTEAVRGARYALCGKLVSTAGDLGRTRAFHVIGAFQSLPARVSTRYSIEGGTFRAQR